MNIVIIDGHPDASEDRYCKAIADAYERGAAKSGHITRKIELAKIDIPFSRSQKEFEGNSLTEPLREAQGLIRWANHIVIIYPLWLGTMPALLKAFLEHVFRPGFGFEAESKGWPKKLLNGRSSRIIVTMGMPAFLYRWYFGAHSLKSLERSILKFCGISPNRETLFGMIDSVGREKRIAWLEKIELLGQSGK